MTIESAKQIVETLVRRTRNCTKLFAILEKQGNDVAVVFKGGLYGEAQIWLSVSSEERIRAHFEGYCQANGLRLVPEVGSQVVFPSGSSPTGFRLGRVLSVGPKRAVVSYKFKNGREATKAVSLTLVQFGHCQKKAG